ncbi:lanthionine synthetase C family protein [Actinocorallia sp. API 0066]|uniref:lanthionine synthetase C family protein n=1 Tax=Actinocorallia sp. API 0066 TaxID=2896846 RepID=UPI001E5EAD3E|nr:lanthionine synthetase C family protein [Actinocorallia sp. API 0066]MCD0447656.1 lanthionine synthetase C family protein [Actinocorallia sp. API 0066]
MTAGQSLADGAAGIALLHLATGDHQRAFAPLELAVAEGVSVTEGASLYYGAPALAFVLAASDHPGLARAKATAIDGTVDVTRQRLDAAHRRIDRRQRPDYAEYDLIRGLTGLGVALRRVGRTDLLRDVLTYLVRLTEPLGPLPGWWCRNGPRRDHPAPADGHGNHGLAHGITGPLALLALTHLDGTHVHGHTDAIQRILTWLDTWRQHTDNGAAWWPQTVTRADLKTARPAQTGPLRPSWCYGTPGIARAQQLAARALTDPDRQHTAETAFTACVTDPAQTSLFTDRSLCHGTAGLLTTARRIAADALHPIPLQHLARLHHTTAFPTDEPTGLLEGKAGTTLATAETTTAWDACLLLC